MRSIASIGGIVTAIAYAEVAAQTQPDGDPLDNGEVGALLAALDQGAALLTLAGSDVLDQRVLRTGMLRLLVPGPTVDGPEGLAGVSALHDPVLYQRLEAELRPWHDAEAAEPPEG